MRLARDSPPAFVATFMLALASATIATRLDIGSGRVPLRIGCKRHTASKTTAVIFSSDPGQPPEEPWSDDAVDFLRSVPLDTGEPQIFSLQSTRILPFLGLDTLACVLDDEPPLGSASMWNWQELTVAVDGGGEFQEYIRSFGQQFQGGGHGLEVHADGDADFGEGCESVVERVHRRRGDILRGVRS